jgi:hypothetical protein
MRRSPSYLVADFGELRWLLRAGGVVRDNKEVNKFIASQTALGRVGLPDDIGGTVASLLADDNLCINGPRIEASAGIFL